MAKKWTKEKVTEEALKYLSVKEWKENSVSSYLASRRLKIYEEASSHMERKTIPFKWNEKTILEDSLKYNSLKEWRESSSSAHCAAKRLGILKSLPIYTTKQRKSLSLTSLKEEALKYSYKGEFYKENPSVYALCVRHPKKDEIFSHMLNKHENWDLEKAQQIASQYETKKDLQKENPKCYDYLVRTSQIDESCSHMKNGRLAYTEQEVMENASLYDCKAKWRQSELNLYEWAWRNGILDKATSHMKQSNSLGEVELTSFVKAHYPNACKKRFGNKEFDIFVPELNLAIEYNGLYWHSEPILTERMSKKEAVNYHLSKTETANQEGFQLVHIWEHEWKTRRSQVENFLKGKLNLGKTIGARKCEFKIIGKDEASVFCEQNHIQGKPYLMVLAIGAYYNDELVTVCTFSYHHRDTSQITLSRMCSKDGVHVAGALSKISKMAYNHFKKPIKTWVHRTLSNGKSYEKSGWVKIETIKPDYFYTKSGQVYSKQSYKKDSIKTKHPEVYSPNKTESEMCTEIGLMRVWDCGKYTYIYSGD